MNHILDAQTRRFARILHYTGVLLLVASVTGSYSLLHAPIIRETEKTVEKIEELSLSVENAVAIHDQHQKVSERLAAIKQQIATVQRRVPNEADSGKFLEEVSRIAGEEKLTIKNFEPGKATEKSGYSQMEVTLSARGSYRSICTFLDRLSSLTRLSKLQNLTLTTTGNATEYPMTATLVIYFALRGKDAKIPPEVKRG
ncbi:MAG: type 4a pilus biogenesis protein PilO [Pirellulales bacterium]